MYETVIKSKENMCENVSSMTKTFSYFRQSAYKKSTRKSIHSSNYSIKGLILEKNKTISVFSIVEEILMKPKHFIKSDSKNCEIFFL